MKINKTNEFIEIIGHYNNKVQCAKMTLLADLYAIEHKNGYAKFPINVADKLGLVDSKLEFAPVTYTYVDNVTISQAGGNSFTINQNGFTVSDYSGFDIPPNYSRSSDTFTYTGEGTFKGLKYNGTVYTSGQTITIPDDGTGHYLTTEIETAPSTTTYEHIKYNDNKIQVDSAIRDGNGLKIDTNYALKEELDEKLDASKQAISDNGGLVSPTAVLSSNELVGVGVNGEQVRVQLGEGLTLSGTTSPYTLSASGGGGGGKYLHKLEFVYDNAVGLKYLITDSPRPLNHMYELTNYSESFCVVLGRIQSAYDSPKTAFYLAYYSVGVGSYMAVNNTFSTAAIVDTIVNFTDTVTPL